MQYEYRRMTPEEREAVVTHRQRQHYPLHAPPHPYREAGWYLLTAANFEHRPIMQATERRDELETCLLEGLLASDCEVAGWVVLPNHYHILAGVPSLDTVSALWDAFTDARRGPGIWRTD